MSYFAVAVTLLAFQNSSPSDLVPPAPVFEVEAGRRIPLTFLKGVSTKTAQAGDPVYLETLFPISANGRIAIPRGSYVQGSVVSAKRAGRVKGRAELRVRLETLILPDGTTKAFSASVVGLDSDTGESVDAEGNVKGKGGLGQDARTIATAASVGAAAGGAIGAVSTIGANADNVTSGQVVNTIMRPMRGAGLGLLGGAAGAYVATLFLRGPDAVIAKGNDAEMVLDIPLRFAEEELYSDDRKKPAEDRTESGLKRRPPSAPAQPKP
jgi:hypothetical protein